MQVPIFPFIFPVKNAFFKRRVRGACFSPVKTAFQWVPPNVDIRTMFERHFQRRRSLRVSNRVGRCKWWDDGFDAGTSSHISYTFRYCLRSHLLRMVHCTTPQLLQSRMILVLKHNDCTGREFASMSSVLLQENFRMSAFQADKVVQARRGYCGQCVMGL